MTDQAAAPATPADQQVVIGNPGSAAGADARISGQEQATSDTGTGTGTGTGFTLDTSKLGIGGGTKTRERQLFEDLQAQMTSAYEQLWGAPPPPGYVANAIKAGENLIEFIDREKHKPEFQNTQSYTQRGSDLAATLATTLGVR